ncbi:MAG TPA: AsmA family protein [Candidatus Binatia bacterium]|nr:AsmA family protein [Candidatus Binatia bacterium]
MRRVLIWLGAILGLLLIVAVIFIATFDWSRAKGYISATVSKATGRQLTINGHLNVDLGWITRVSAGQIQFENAPWSKNPQMVEVGLVDLELDLWQLLKWRFVLPSVTVSQAKVRLERNAEGSSNWDFRAAPAVTEPVVPEKRTEFPVIEKLILNDGTLLFTSQESNARFELVLTHAEAEGFWEGPVTFKAKGTYQKQPMTLSLQGGSYQNLTSSSEPYPLQIDLHVGKLKATLDGKLTEPLELKGEDVMLDIQGDDMANLFPLTRLVFPSTPPYRLKGHLKRERDIWAFSDFSGRVGDSDLFGNIRVDTKPKRNFMKADLVSSLLDFDDLAGFVGGKPGTAPGETASQEQKKQAVTEKGSDRIFPDQRYDLDRLTAMDADVRLRAKHIVAPRLPIQNLDAKLSLNNGVLKFEPATFGVANGRVEIYSTFDGSKRPPKINIDARLRQLDLREFISKESFAQKTLGPIAGRITLSGTGDSFRELMATASGNTFLVMSGGEISGLLVELVGLDVAQGLGIAVRGDKSIPIRCAVLDLEGKDGQMGVRTLVFDTTDTIIFGEGKIDLGEEKVNIILTPVPKDFSPLSLRSFVRVTGPFKKISAFPDPLKTGTDSLLKKIFNVLVTLATSVFQPRDLATGRDINCEALIATLKEKDPRGIVLSEIFKSGGSKQAGDRTPAEQQARGRGKP